MKLHASLHGLVWTTISLALNACSTWDKNQAPILTVSELYAAPICNRSKQSITQIDNTKDLNNVLIDANFHKLNQKASHVPEIDFSTTHAYLISLGTKTNAAYNLRKTGNKAHIVKDVLYLPYRVESPPKGSMSAQVMISPCAIITLPIRPYNKIDIQNW